MKISVFYDHIIEASEKTGKPLDEILFEVRQAGIEAVEINSTYLKEHKDTLDLLKKYDLKVSCLYEFYKMDTHYEILKAYRHVEMAKIAGAGFILIVPGFFKEETDEFCKVYDDYDKASKFLSESKKARKMAKGVRRLTKLAAKNGIQAVIEDFDDVNSPISCVNGMKWLLGEVRELRVAFDTGNFIIHGEDIFKAFDTLRDEIVHVHCKDRSTEPIPVGEGNIPVADIVKRLKESGYNGYLAIEHFGVSNQEAAMLKSADFLKNVF